MVLNVIEPAQTRYIPLAEDLEIFLRDKFGEVYPGYDFNVEVYLDSHTSQINVLFSNRFVCSMFAIDGLSKLQRRLMRYFHTSEILL